MNWAGGCSWPASSTWWEKRLCTFMAGGGEAGPKSPAPAHHPTDPGIRLRPGANSRSPRVPGSGVLPQFRPVCLGDHGVALGTAGGFFGRPARTTPVAARRASSDGNLPGPLPLEKTGEAQPNNKRHLEIQSRAIEAWVRAEPAQWLWLHRRWKNQFFCGKSYAAITTGPHLKRMGYLR